MLSAETAIARTRRDLTVGALVKGGLLAAALAALFAPQVVQLSPYVDRTVVLVVVGVVWMALSFTSAKGSRLAADSPALIASGRFEEAERQIDQALRSFSLFRGVKLQTLHHLALLRHAQRRWREAAVLCSALLGQRLGAMTGISKPALLLLADSMLEMGDLPGADRAITGLYAHRLSLNEVMTLLRVQLDYEVRIGAWDRVMTDPMGKVQLAELMPSMAAARVQALIALAGKKAGRQDWCDWLRRRAELLADPKALIADRPVLAELW